MFVNYSVLDSLVVEYLFQTGHSSQIPRDLLSEQLSDESADVAMNLKDLVCQGDIETAMAIAVSMDSEDALSRNTQTKFQLYHQLFLHLLISQSVEAALRFCRQSFAPFAINAHANAWSDFKRCLIALLSTDPSKLEEAHPAKRAVVASSLAHVLFPNLNTYEPVLTSAIKYLILVSRLASNLPLVEGSEQVNLSAEVESLIRSQRDPPPNLNGYQEFPEKDVQDIVTATGITRQEAIESLKHANGSPSRAVLNNLQLYEMDEMEVDRLVMSFAMSRGLVLASNTDSSNTRCDEQIAVVRSAFSRYDFDTKSVQICLSTFAEGPVRCNELHFWFLCVIIIDNLISNGTHSCLELLRDSGIRNLLEELKEDEYYDMHKRLATAVLVIDQKTLQEASANQKARICLFQQICDKIKLDITVLASRTLSRLWNVHHSESLPLADIFSTLLTHHDYYYRIRSKTTDRFADVFRIDRLTSGAETTLEEPQVEPAQVNEAHVLTLMEFLATTRSEALAMLEAAGGDIEVVIDRAFQ